MAISLEHYAAQRRPRKFMRTGRYDALAVHHPDMTQGIAPSSTPPSSVPEQTRTPRMLRADRYQALKVTAAMRSLGLVDPNLQTDAFDRDYKVRIGKPSRYRDFTAARQQTTARAGKPVIVSIVQSAGKRAGKAAARISWQTPARPAMHYLGGKPRKPEEEYALG